MTDFHRWSLSTLRTHMCAYCGTIAPLTERVVPIFCPGSLSRPHVFVATPAGVCCGFCGQKTDAQVMPNEMTWECPC